MQLMILFVREREREQGRAREVKKKGEGWGAVSLTPISKCIIHYYKLSLCLQPEIIISVAFACLSFCLFVC